MKREKCRCCDGAGRVYSSLADKYVPCDPCGGAGWFSATDEGPDLDAGDEPDVLLWPESVRWIRERD